MYKIDKLLTVAQAAEAYNLPKWKIWHAVRAGLLPVVKLLNSRIYLRSEDIEAALAQSKGGHDGK